MNGFQVWECEIQWSNIGQEEESKLERGRKRKGLYWPGDSSQSITADAYDTGGRYGA